ncbi:hypothetical protein [Algibacter mikhailovii]|uniref:hypothetical protein n=1 Tax=Algibacter mikhailovii TaxID=425498 RepID=UPI002495710B|nr:hypothetical protein [Algibacter mikhailovii]
MKYLLYFTFFISIPQFAQESVEAVFIETIPLDNERIVSFDNFGIPYYLKNNIFYTKSASGNVTYNNLQLGQLHSVNTFNPLKINLFYKDFNTLIILDNRLAEIYKVDFNTSTPYLNVSFVSTGHDNTVWVFNQDLQRLELYDYKARTSRSQTVPIQNPVLDLQSDFNYCWLLTDTYLYVYNYFGRMTGKIENKGYTSLIQNNENLILKKENFLYYLKKNSEQPMLIKTPNILIEAFFVVNETLYIYNGETLEKFQLKIK